VVCTINVEYTAAKISLFVVVTERGFVLARQGATQYTHLTTPAYAVQVRSTNTAVLQQPSAPAVVVLPHDGDDEAVAIANDSAYGLYSYVYAGDMARAYRIARRLESGNVALNSIVPHPNAPFGGFKESGIGRDRGIAGLEAYSEVQAISWMA